MAVEISDLNRDPVETYIARCEGDCKDRTDLEVYRLVNDPRWDVITMGKVIGRKVKDGS